MNKKFTAPKNDPEFLEYWNLFLPKVVERDNFDNAHLKALEVLCDVYVHYHELTQDIKDNGYVYTSDGRYGISERERAACKLQQKYLSEIRAYSKMLDLIPTKDNSKKDQDNQDEWD
jgi:phage terminase small subunit